jgi:hypothetical protein
LLAASVVGLSDTPLAQSMAAAGRQNCQRVDATMRRIRQARVERREAGNVWQRRSDISFDNSIIGGSVFFGMDTLIGPIYLAYGHSDTGESAIYIRLGPRLAF